jgi:hypothetical protein
MASGGNLVFDLLSCVIKLVINRSDDTNKKLKRYMFV